MPHDRNGTELQQDDIVFVPARVKLVRAPAVGTDECDLFLEFDLGPNLKPQFWVGARSVVLGAWASGIARSFKAPEKHDASPMPLPEKDDARLPEAMSKIEETMWKRYEELRADHYDGEALEILVGEQRAEAARTAFEACAKLAEESIFLSKFPHDMKTCDSIAADIRARAQEAEHDERR